MGRPGQTQTQWILKELKHNKLRKQQLTVVIFPEESGGLRAIWCGTVWKEVLQKSFIFLCMCQQRGDTSQKKHTV